MTRKLEEEFNLPPIDEIEIHNEDNTVEEFLPTTQEIEDAITLSDKINSALVEVKGMESHDKEMDEIADEAMNAFKQLMDLGYNIQDMAAGQVFGNAQQMLKVALEARDSKVNRKLKQIDLMLKKARLDQAERKMTPTDDDELTTTSKPLDRNELLKLLNQKD